MSQKSFVGQNFRSLVFCFSNFLRVYLIDVYVRNTLHPWYRAHSPVLHPWYRAHTHVKLLKTYRPLKGILKTFENNVLRRNYVSKKFHTFLAMKHSVQQIKFIQFSSRGRRRRRPSDLYYLFMKPPDLRCHYVGR